MAEIPSTFRNYCFMIDEANMFGHKNKPGIVFLKLMAVTLTMPIRPYYMFNTSDYNMLPALYGWLTVHYVLVLAVFFSFFSFSFFHGPIRAW